jgi:hypothetical protein
VDGELLRGVVVHAVRAPEVKYTRVEQRREDVRGDAAGAVAAVRVVRGRRRLSHRVVFGGGVVRVLLLVGRRGRGVLISLRGVRRISRVEDGSERVVVVLRRLTERVRLHALLRVERADEPVRLAQVPREPRGVPRLGGDRESPARVLLLGVVRRRRRGGRGAAVVFGGGVHHRIVSSSSRVVVAVPPPRGRGERDRAGLEVRVVRRGGLDDGVVPLLQRLAQRSRIVLLGELGIALVLGEVFPSEPLRVVALVLLVAALRLRGPDVVAEVADRKLAEG